MAVYSNRGCALIVNNANGKINLSILEETLLSLNYKVKVCDNINNIQQFSDLINDRVFMPDCTWNRLQKAKREVKRLPLHDNRKIIYASLNNRKSPDWHSRFVKTSTSLNMYISDEAMSDAKASFLVYYFGPANTKDELVIEDAANNGRYYVTQSFFINLLCSNIPSSVTKVFNFMITVTPPTQEEENWTYHNDNNTHPNQNIIWIQLLENEKAVKRFLNCLVYYMLNDMQSIKVMYKFLEKQQNDSILSYKTTIQTLYKFQNIGKKKC